MFNRRDFLKGSAAAFFAAMLPFRSKTTGAVETVAVQEYRLSDTRCYFGMEGSHGKVYGTDVTIRVRPLGSYGSTVSHRKHRKSPVDDMDPKFVGKTKFGIESINYRQHTQTEISIGELSGNVRDMAEVLNALRVGNPLRMLFSSQYWRVLDDLKLAFFVERPVLTSLHRTAFTPATSIDAYGHNGGKDIEVPDEARMLFIQDVHIVSPEQPQSIDDADWLGKEWFQQRHCPSANFSHEELEKAYNKRRENMTPEQIAVEEEAIRRYASGNVDSMAWNRAEEQLVDHDPAKFKVADWISPGPRGERAPEGRS